MAPEQMELPPVLFESDGMAPTPGDAVAVRATPSHAAYSRARPGRLLLKVDFAAALTASTARPPLNIALVLDRSGSMKSDRKFEYTLEAARWVISNLSPRDTLSIVAFNHESTVIAAASPVVNKPFLFHRLEEVHPDGRTDISAAMLEAVAQIESQHTDGAVKHVLVLTDGIANTGVTSADGLANIAAKAQARGIGVSTLGCGTEFDQEALTKIANAGAGRYTYVSNSEQIPTAFQSELHGLLATIAQNVVLRVTVRGASIRDVSGQVLNKPTRSYELRIGNLRATERGSIVLQLAPDTFTEGSAVQYQVVLTFDDPKAGRRERRVAASSLPYAATDDPAALAPNETVIIYGGILDALQRAEEATLGRDRNRTRLARELMRKWYSRAHDHAMQTRNQELLNHAFMLKHFLAELDSLGKQGDLHGHNEARERLRKRGHYQRYLLMHHRGAAEH